MDTYRRLNPTKSKFDDRLRIEQYGRKGRKEGRKAFLSAKLNRDGLIQREGRRKRGGEWESRITIEDESPFSSFS